MKQLLKGNLRYFKRTNSLFIAAFVLIFSVTPIALYSIANLSHSIHADIVQHSRGSYDLLVRPPEAITTLEEEIGMVPENYIGGGQGGISLNQWKSIKNNIHTEIAAPIASLGYFTGLNTTLGVLPSPKVPSVYEVEYVTSDGVNEYTTDTYRQIFMHSAERGLPLVTQVEMLSYIHPLHALFPLPITYNLLVGIDPEEEEKLTGIDFASIQFGKEAEGIIRKNTAGHEKLKDAQIVPVLQLRDDTISLEAKVSSGELAYSPQEIQKLVEEHGLDEQQLIDFENPGTRKLFERLLRSPVTNEFSHDLSLLGYLQPFNAEAKGLVVMEDGEVEDMDTYSDTTSYASSVNWNSSTKYYKAGPVPYKRTSDGLQVTQVGTEHGVPIYRSLEEKGTTITSDDQTADSLSILTDPVGYYETGKTKERLAASPLGIYQLEPVTYKETDGVMKTLTPTYTPGSFVTAPAEGVTNIESSRLVKGDTPIDAIRVKVADITDYTPSAAQKIEDVANEIRGMGLHVDVIAGSSLQTLDVDVEGLGVVQESWTSLGASGKIVNQWNATTLVLAIMFAIVAFLFLMNRIRLWSGERQQSVQLLKLLGWTSKDIRKLYMKEMNRLLMIVVAVSSVFIITFIYANEVSFRLAVYQVLIVVVLVLLIIGFTCGQVQRLLHNPENTKKGRKVTRSRSLVVRNILYYRKSITATFIQLIIVSSLASFVYLSLNESVMQTNATVLGKYVNAEIGNWNKLLLAATYIMAFITLLENMSRMLQERSQELESLKQIGWKFKDIQRTFLKELSIWTGTSVVCGSVLSGLLFATFYPITGTNALFLLLTSVALFSLIIAQCYILVNYRIRKIMP
ncbi:ABC transporter permease [Sporosarcina sp. BI001-red]|uniref:FtsX-like permease family protein n=1 Tax=Sporosarcina sp. BI001-red TaxID=2282866 RepID=UPI000E281A40|nr:FtsX-like permease family protein [Sporosarcina sp. BI001-red]REB07331.1 ABC transporter permease [Sporosarcina sp. BI001-red]